MTFKEWYNNPSYFDLTWTRWDTITWILMIVFVVVLY